MSWTLSARGSAYLLDRENEWCYSETAISGTCLCCMELVIRWVLWENRPVQGSKQGCTYPTLVEILSGISRRGDISWKMVKFLDIVIPNTCQYFEQNKFSTILKTRKLPIFFPWTDQFLRDTHLDFCTNTLNTVCKWFSKWRYVECKQVIPSSSPGKQWIILFSYTFRGSRLGI